MNSKYRAKQTEYRGVRYASKQEAKRAQELDLLRKAGEIRGWFPHPRFVLTRQGFRMLKDGEKTKRSDFVYSADFFVHKNKGRFLVEDAKGMMKQRDRDILKLWRIFGEYPLHYRFSDSRKNIVIEPIR